MREKSRKKSKANEDTVSVARVLLGARHLRRVVRQVVARAGTCHRVTLEEETQCESLLGATNLFQVIHDVGNHRQPSSSQLLVLPDSLATSSRTVHDRIPEIIPHCTRQPFTLQMTVLLAHFRQVVGGSRVISIQVPDDVVQNLYSNPAVHDGAVHVIVGEHGDTIGLGEKLSGLSVPVVQGGVEA